MHKHFTTVHLCTKKAGLGFLPEIFVHNVFFLSFHTSLALLFIYLFSNPTVTQLITVYIRCVQPQIIFTCIFLNIDDTRNFRNVNCKS